MAELGPELSFRFCPSGLLSLGSQATPTEGDPVNAS